MLNPTCVGRQFVVAQNDGLTGVASVTVFAVRRLSAEPSAFLGASGTIDGCATITRAWPPNVLSAFVVEPDAVENTLYTPVPSAPAGSMKLPCSAASAA